MADAGGALPPLIAVLRANNSEFLTSMKEAASATKKVKDETGKTTTVAKSNFERLAGAGKVMAVGMVGVATTVGGAAIKMGMDFQESMTTLVTGAGESEKNIKMVGDGILAMAGKVGKTPEELASGMYMIESAGYHGAQGLDVLKAAAEGARVGNADMKVVANGVTTALTDYHMSASQAAATTSALVQTVADGKTNLQDLAGSLGNVLPLAAQLHVGFADVTGAIAAMTNQGMDAQRASQNLNAMIGALAADSTPKAKKALAEVGLTAQQLNDSLQHKGLPQTLQMIEDQVGKKFPAGSAAYMDAMRHLLGGQSGLDVALMLSGQNMKAFQGNVENISEKLKGGGKDVEGFAETQKDLKTKLENAKDGAEAMITSLGMKLIPVVTSVIGKVTSFGNVLMQHTGLLYTIAGVVGGVVVAAITAYIAAQVKAAAQTVASFTRMIGKATVWAATKIGLFESVGAGAQASAEAEVAAQEEVSTAEEAATAVAEEEGAAQAAAFGPIGLAVMALIAVITLLVTHWQQVWGVIKTVFGAVWDFLKGAWDWIAQTFIGGIRSGVHMLAQEWSAAWNGIKAAFSAVWDFLKSVFSLLVGTYIKVLETELHVLEAVWSAVWGGIKAALSAVWDFLKAAWSWISGVFIAAFQAELHGLQAVFSAVWGGIRSVVSGVWGFLQGVWGGITGGVRAVWGVIQSLGGVFSSVFGGIRSAVEGAWNVIRGIFDAISRAVGGVIHAVGSVVNTISSVAGKVGSFLGFANGGFVPGPIGAPRLAVVHGGEYVLSNDMLDGRQEPTDLAKAAKNANGYTAASPSQQALTSNGTGGAPTVIVQAQTNASPQAIASQVGWTLRSMA